MFYREEFFCKTMQKMVSYFCQMFSLMMNYYSCEIDFILKIDKSLDTDFFARKIKNFIKYGTL